jgi:methylmalonyl-CoA epimerase
MSFKIELDHIGVATPEIQSGNFFEILGLQPGGTEKVPTEQVKVGFYGTDNGANIELLEPLSEDGPIGKFLQKRGPGIHHICFRVQGLDALVQTLLDKGVQLINEEPRPGAHNCRVVFVHPKSTGGVLVELSERAEL